MTRIVVTGYASLDHIALLDGVPEFGRTTTILNRPVDAWPRLGGSPAYVAAAAVRQGVADTVPISWIGDDDDGREYRRQLADRNVRDEGLAIVNGMRTPIALMIYKPKGGCMCLYDPGTPQDIILTTEQHGLVETADWICITIGPSSVTCAVLDTIGPDSRLAWVVKHDPRSMPLTLAAELAGRADLICFSQAERVFVQKALERARGERAHQILIETKGHSGASFTRDGRTENFMTEPLTINDPTGAGDTFAGGVLAVLATGETKAVPIVGAGHQAARRLLLGRQVKQSKVQT